MKQINRRKLEDHTGKRLGMLTIIGNTEPKLTKKGWRRCMVIYRCDCGKEGTREMKNITYAAKSGVVPSCGCNRSVSNIKHGMSATSTYHIWAGIVRRGTGKEHQRYYADRGIKVCERWMTFENFLEDMGPRPHPKMSVERLDNDKDYEPGNCVWATQAAQTRNTRQSRMVEYKGETMCVTDLAKKLGLKRDTLNARLNKYGVQGIDKPLAARPVVVNGVSMELKSAAKKAGLGYATVQSRLKRGWTLEDALKTPVMPKSFRYKSLVSLQQCPS